jgi:hypothetical protein
MPRRKLKWPNDPRTRRDEAQARYGNGICAARKVV